jgi:hypothetical protein
LHTVNGRDHTWPIEWCEVKGPGLMIRHGRNEILFPNNGTKSRGTGENL